MSGKTVWVHCAQGINRGPSGVLAYLLMYTTATWEEACKKVKAARKNARTKHNTFVEQLLLLAKEPKMGHVDFHGINIEDGGQ